MPTKIVDTQHWTVLEKKSLHFSSILEKSLATHVISRVLDEFLLYGFDSELSRPLQSKKKSAFNVAGIRSALGNDKQYSIFLNFTRSLDKPQERPNLPTFFKPSSTFCKSPANNIFRSFDRIIRINTFGYDVSKYSNENFKVSERLS